MDFFKNIRQQQMLDKLQIMKSVTQDLSDYYIDADTAIQKGKKANTGEVRIFGGKAYKKRADGQWRPVNKGEQNSPKETPKEDDKKVATDSEQLEHEKIINSPEYKKAYDHYLQDIPKPSKKDRNDAHNFAVENIRQFKAVNEKLNQKENKEEIIDQIDLDSDLQDLYSKIQKDPKKFWRLKMLFEDEEGKPIDIENVDRVLLAGEISVLDSKDPWFVQQGVVRDAMKKMSHKIINKFKDDLTSIINEYPNLKELVKIKISDNTIYGQSSGWSLNLDIKVPGKQAWMKPDVSPVFASFETRLGEVYWHAPWGGVSSLGKNPKRKDIERAIVRTIEAQAGNPKAILNK